MVRASVVAGVDAPRKQMLRGTAVYGGSAGRVYAESRTARPVERRSTLAKDEVVESDDDVGRRRRSEQSRCVRLWASIVTMDAEQMRKAVPDREVVNVWECRTRAQGR